MNRFLRFRKISVNSFRLTSLILFLFVSQTFAQEHLVIVGGGTRPEAATSKFVEWAGGERRARILVIPWATEEPQESFEYLKKDFEVFHPSAIELAPIAPLTAEKKAAFLNQLKTATGVFFTGGDQVKIMKVLKDETLIDALKKRYADGAVFGGTSAGTAVMSEEMITGEGDFTVIDGSRVETARGLGLLPSDVIVDQHFIKRQRQNRLFGLILKSPEKFGVGIDEGAALLVTNNRYAEVVGASQVMIVSSPKRGVLNVFLASPGAEIDLKKRALHKIKKRLAQNAGSGR
ncbi:MAG: cyanophycinase [Pyrinomonadaceae bacterium]